MILDYRLALYHGTIFELTRGMKKSSQQSTRTLYFYQTMTIHSALRVHPVKSLKGNS
jgi:hypothetical protein